MRTEVGWYAGDGEGVRGGPDGIVGGGNAEDTQSLQIADDDVDGQGFIVRSQKSM